MLDNKLSSTLIAIEIRKLITIIIIIAAACLTTSAYSQDNENKIISDPGMEVIAIPPRKTNTVNAVQSSNYGVTILWHTFWDNQYSHSKSYNYLPGTYVSFYYTDFDYLNKNYFFNGFSGIRCDEGDRSKEIGRCSFYVYGNTEFSGDFQQCAELYPKTLRFKSLNELERKLVQLARNNPDPILKLKASGEVGALAVAFPNGGICAKFFEGQNGKVSISFGQYEDFMWSYPDKNINNLLDYHTHDGNSTKTADSIISWGLDSSGKLVGPPGTIPSIQDLMVDFELNKKFSRNFNITSRVISPAANGYSFAFGPKFNAVKFRDNAPDILEQTLKIKFKSVNKKLTTQPTLKDIKAALEYLDKQYKKYGLILKAFNVK